MVKTHTMINDPDMAIGGSHNVSRLAVRIVHDCVKSRDLSQRF